MSNLKLLSISLILLYSFAATSKLGAMMKNQPNQKPIQIYLQGHGGPAEERREILNKMSQFSKDGLKESDMPWIISKIQRNTLGKTALKRLSVLGLKKYINYIDRTSGATCLREAILRDNLETIKFLVSIGAKIDEADLETAGRILRKRILSTQGVSPFKFFPATEKDITASKEICDFLREELEKEKEKTEEQKETRKRLKYLLEAEEGKYIKDKLPAVETSDKTIRVMNISAQ